MKRETMICILGLAALLSACGGPLVTLKNPESGQLASCKGGLMATGMASDRVQQDLLTECVDGYTRQGYEVVSASN